VDVSSEVVVSEELAEEPWCGEEYVLAEDGVAAPEKANGSAELLARLLKSLRLIA
jgi:hypothetical protein